MNEEKKMKGAINLMDHLAHDPRCRYDKMARGEPSAWIRMVKQFICPACARKQLEGQIWCPACMKWYMPKYPSREEVPEEDKEAIEQWIAGFCSTKCWNELLGVEG